ncbi:3-deoxy-manno-octulosonate cytidylyltransferase [Rhodopirellula sp. MGV]|uniref:3-deoxy-manno-octulosonate cytidylyltransferase n=1 Tax=Rhodopirellula sp. MGV TaxID=2023130 RepID=UPI000B960045|nr:3-deoxy-manno-octulosonate cytidylyltransferase [Rhodopirellula sp. MGV]OYP29823.1 3-deoxy-manno-octulosonate cytidylyltransferase [Rhodopirellula sp. MGV]PNY33705.1 3-deoxy-manno-octulosonate cytidylyltransferase [Rhodopirellula baltica]
MTKTQIVLPARLASSRLHEKLLQVVAGKTVLQHTYEAASRAKSATSGVIIALDDPRLTEAVESFGGRWIMTPQDCASGTDRIAYVAEQMPDVDLFINVQSDEPEIDPESIDAVAAALLSDSNADLSTAATPIRSAAALTDPGIVKVVMANADDGAGRGRAVYFSRACVPHDRDGDPSERLHQTPATYWHHLGLYAYRPDFLRWFASAPQSHLEQVEKLEQLRAIEAGKKIAVAFVGPAASGIDTPADLDAFRNRFKNTSPSV